MSNFLFAIPGLTFQTIICLTTQSRGPPHESGIHIINIRRCVGPLFWLLGLKLISSWEDSQMNWKQWTLLFLLVVIVFPIIGMVLKSHNRQQILRSNESQVISEQNEAATKTQTSSASPTYDSEGWTEESTGSADIGPWLNYSPAGTRYYRDANDYIIRVYPPGVKTDAPPASAFSVGESTVTIPLASSDPLGTRYVISADGKILRLVPYSGDYEPLPSSNPSQ